MLTVKQIEALDIYPMYVFEEGYCDKLYKKDGNVLRTRYNLTKNTCTCISFMKGFYCKHLKMREGNLIWLKGISSENAIDCIIDIMQQLGKDVYFDIEMPHLNYNVTIETFLDVDKVVLLFRRDFAVVFQNSSKDASKFAP